MACLDDVASTHLPQDSSYLPSERSAIGWSRQYNVDARVVKLAAGAPS